MRWNSPAPSGIVQTLREIVPTLRGNMKKRRKMPRNGWHFPFSFFVAQSSRSETEFIGFAGRRARTEPGPGPPFRFLSAQGSRSETEFIAFAGRRARTNLPPALALQNNKPASGSNSLTMSLAEHAIRLPPGDTSRILRSCQPGWPSLACSFSSSS